MGRPWYAFYPDDYERSTAHLTYVQDSAYRRMLDHYYKTGEPLPPDRESIYRACRAMCREERAAIDYCLKAFFVAGDDGFHQIRADAELVKAAELSAKRTDAANKRYANASANADRLHSKSIHILHSTTTATSSEANASSESISTAPSALVPPAVALPTNRFSKTGEEVGVFPAQIADYATTFPAVDVPQQLREMRRWLIDNPERRKTAKGIPKFINRWLSKEQDKGKSNGSPGRKQAGNGTSHDRFFAAAASLIRDELGDGQAGPGHGDAVVVPIGRPLLQA